MLRKIYITFFILITAVPAFAIPVMEVGAPGGLGEGTYANYQKSLTNPTETDTAITYGTTLYIAGMYQNSSVQSLGGKYTGGKDWSSMSGETSKFNGHGAILVASVPDGATGTLKISLNGGTTFINPFYTSTSSSYFPTSHDPVKSNIADFLFFDIGTFAKKTGAVTDFASETGSANGEMKTLIISVAGYTWVHFDVMALQTSKSGSTVTTTLVSNPAGYDVTRDPAPDPPKPVPEPATLFLVGSGLIGIGVYARKRFKK
jgi:hypothetical protein